MRERVNHCEEALLARLERGARRHRPLRRRVQPEAAEEHQAAVEPARRLAQRLRRPDALARRRAEQRRQVGLDGQTQ